MDVVKRCKMFAQHDLKLDDLFDCGLNKLKEDGYVIFERLLDLGFVEELYAAYRERIHAPVSYSGKLGRMVDKRNVMYVDLPLTLHPNAVKLAVCEPIIQAVEKYLNVDVVLSYAVSYRTNSMKYEAMRKFFERPGAAFSSWHSDANVISHGYRFIVSILYLNDVELGGGGLQVIRGSHAYGGQKRLWLPKEIEERSQDIVEVCAPAGSVILFDMEIIHRAGIPIDHHRDIFRCCYVPEGGYAEPLVFSSDTLPAEIGPKVARLLRLGQRSSIPLPLSEGIPKRNLFSPESSLGRTGIWLKYVVKCILRR